MEQLKKRSVDIVACECHMPVMTCLDRVKAGRADND
jgi:hypothetical protein